MSSSDAYLTRVEAKDLLPIVEYPRCFLASAYLNYVPEEDGEKTLDISFGTTDPRGQWFVPSYSLWFKLSSSYEALYPLKRAYFLELREREVPYDLMLKMVSLPRLTLLGTYLPSRSRNYLFFVHEYLREVAIENKIALIYLDLVKSRKR